ncbi:MAG: hypothetical protein EHM56_06855 [Chloroflexi bacterium]|nr:MAG: hypothetical protein EHM56_06855 [Chloroflexota bacterium]
MKSEEIQDHRLSELVQELSEAIKIRYPEAVFKLSRWNGDPRSVYVHAYTTEEEDGFLVMDPVAAREIEILSEEGYDIHVIPLPLSALESPDLGVLSAQLDRWKTGSDPDPDSEEWDALLARPDAQRLLAEMAREAREDYAAGRTTGIAAADDGGLEPE